MTIKTISSDAYVWPAETGSSIICDGRITDQIVDDFGTNVKIREVNQDNYNPYGDATKKYSDSYTKAYIHQWSSTDDEVKEGVYKNGQIMFVFKLISDSLLKTGNFIFYASEWYQIRRVEYQMLAGVKYLINATVAKAQLS